jgi:cytochrome c-type biogenesis protein CcmH/NrfF
MISAESRKNVLGVGGRSFSSDRNVRQPTGLEPLRKLRKRFNEWHAHSSRCASLRSISLLFLLVAFSTPAQTSYSPRAKEIGMHLKCQCRGCEMSAGGCAHPGGAFSGPCDTAKAMLKEIDQHLAKGESEQQIIDDFVAQYGAVVYVEPPKRGFGLVAWLMPVFYFVIGLALVVFIVRKWALRPHAAATKGPAVPSEALARARAQAARDTED